MKIKNMISLLSYLFSVTLLIALISWEEILISCVLFWKKNKPCVLPHSSDTFNSIIHTLCLREIHMMSGLYTWSNKQKNPTLEKLDRILMSPGWELLFPLVSVRRLVRDQSDHSPLLLDTGDKIVPSKKRSFKFDTAWL
jgi:exonuclease III